MDMQKQRDEEEKRKNPDKFKPKKLPTNMYKNGIDGELR